MTEETFLALLIEDRPQISIEVDPTGTVLVGTARIGDDFQRVEHEHVRVPFQDLPAVIEALQKVVDDHGIE